MASKKAAMAGATVPAVDPEKAAVMADGFASVAEGMKFLAIGHSRLYELMNGGELTYCQFGRRRRIPWVALRQYAAKHMTIASA
jgi:hypothetical protein